MSLGFLFLKLIFYIFWGELDRNNSDHNELFIIFSFQDIARANSFPWFSKTSLKGTSWLRHEKLFILEQWRRIMCEGIFFLFIPRWALLNKYHYEKDTLKGIMLRKEHYTSWKNCCPDGKYIFIKESKVNKPSENNFCKLRSYNDYSY